MSIYHLLVTLIIILAVLLHGEQKGNNKYIITIILLLFCVYGLRDAYSIGGDSSSSYLHQFERMEDTDWDDLPGLKDWLGTNEEDSEKSTHDRNIGLPWLMKLIYVWTDGDYQILVTLIAAFVMVAFFVLVYRYSISPIQTFLCYLGLLYFTMMFNVLKQSVAMGFVMLSFCALMDRKPFWFVLSVIAGALFHFPALVFLPAYWITKMKIDRNYLILLAALFIITYIFRDRLLDWMLDNYETSVDENSGMRYLSNKVLVMLAIISFALLFRPPYQGDGIYCALLQLMGVAAVIQTFAGYNNTFERLADYYYQFSVLFIPMAFEKVKTNRQYLNTRTLYLVRNLGPYVFCIFAIWRFLHTTMNDATIYPYQFYFQA